MRLAAPGSDARPPARPSYRLLFAILLVALCVRALSALPQAQPGYMDAAYYFDVASNMASGRGLSEDFIWNYLAHPSSLPQPGNAYWMPLTSAMVAPFLLLSQNDFRAAQIPMVMLGALLVPLTYWLSLRLFGRRDWAAASSFLMLGSAFYAPYWPAIDSFAIYALIGTGVLWLVAGWPSANAEASEVKDVAGARAGSRRTTSLRRPLTVGVLIGLAHLTRADGFLLFAMLLPGLRINRRSARVAVTALAGYALVMLPWFIRNIAAFGTPLAGGGAMFLRAYNELFAYDQAPGLQTWVAAGWEPIIANAVRASTLNMATLAGALFFIYVPLVVVAAWNYRKHSFVRATAAYGSLLLFAHSVVLSVPGPRGTFLHSLAAIVPAMYVLAPAGLSSAIQWIAQRRSTWNAPQAERVFGSAFIALALLLSGYFYVASVRAGDVQPAWNDRFASYQQVEAFLRKEAPGAHGPLICINPPAYYYFNHEPAIALPSDDPLALMHAAAQFGARYFIVEADHPAYLDSLYAFDVPDGRFQLRATFSDAAGNPVQLFQIVPLR